MSLSVRNYSDDSLNNCSSAIAALQLSRDTAVDIKTYEDQFAQGLGIDPLEFSSFCEHLDRLIDRGGSMPGQQVKALVETEFVKASTKSKILLCQLIHDLEYRRKCIAKPVSIPVSSYQDREGATWNIAQHSSVGIHSHQPVPQIRSYNHLPNCLIFVENRTDQVGDNDNELLDSIASAAKEAFVPSPWELGLKPKLAEDLFKARTDSEKIEFVRTLSIDNFIDQFFLGGEEGSLAEAMRQEVLNSGTRYAKHARYKLVVNLFLEQFNAEYDSEINQVDKIRQFQDFDLRAYLRTMKSLFQRGSIFNLDKIYIDAYDYLAGLDPKDLI